ncbi:hypothetical protein D3C71_2078200 [compost metagenome]
MMGRNQPFVVLELIGEGVARWNLAAILQSEGVDARVERFVTAQFNRTAIDLAVRMLLQEVHEIFLPFLLR